MVTGDLATTWLRTAAVTIAQTFEVATHLCEHTDPRLLPTLSRLFRRARVPVVEIEKDTWSFTFLSKISEDMLIYLWIRYEPILPLPLTSCSR